MIRLTDICKSFGDKRVLENVSLSFDVGVTCIMGPSGKGKTTLANIIAGLIPPDSGEISGLEDKKVSMVFQEDRLLEWETAIKNLLFVRKDTEEAKRLLTAAGLADSMYKKASELSGGMKRRVCLCRALIAEYDLLVLDEPFKGLDSGIKHDVMKMVLDNTVGKTVICITHDHSEAEFLGSGAQSVLM